MTNIDLVKYALKEALPGDLSALEAVMAVGGNILTRIIALIEYVPGPGTPFLSKENADRVRDIIAQMDHNLNGGA